MEGMKKTIAVSTKQYAGADSVRTNLTIDATGLTPAEMFEYVIDAATIKWQAAIRRKKDSVIPTTATYIVPKPGTRAAATILPFDALVMICDGDKEMALAIVDEYGSVELAFAAMKEIVDNMKK